MDQKDPPIRPQNWSAEDKFKAVIETESMTEDQISEYCRRKGLYTAHLQEWKQSCLESMKVSVTKNSRAEVQQLKAELKKVQKDLNRKDKALAETSALLVLKKKANLIWGDGEDV
jgi:transposase-like protein